jgi:hypothetical protein
MRGPIKAFVMVGAMLTALSTSLLGAGPALAAVWTVAPSPPTGQDAIVGTYLQTVYGNIWDPYSVHWDGTAWNLVTMPQVNGAVFTSADAISPANVWAVGNSPSGPLIAHWNGTAWTITPSPAAGTLTGITARSASDVWAVGYTTGPQTLTLHWDGTTWTTVSSPNVGSASQLTSVSASPGAAIVWAAGYSGVSGSFNPLTVQNG